MSKYRWDIFFLLLFFNTHIISTVWCVPNTLLRVDKMGFVGGFVCLFWYFIIYFVLVAFAVNCWVVCFFSIVILPMWTYETWIWIWERRTSLCCVCFKCTNLSVRVIILIIITFTADCIVHLVVYFPSIYVSILYVNSYRSF